jgi:hypothetical protein
MSLSDTDSFIDEVTEEVRRDRLFALMRKYGWIGVVAVLGIVGGAAFNEWQKARAEAEAQAFGDSVMSAMEAEDRAAALAAVSADGARAGVLALIAAAETEATDAEGRAAALAKLSAVASDSEVPQSLRDLARLKSVIVGGAAMDAATRDASLATLAAPGAPYRLLAMEQQALVHVAEGRTDAAVDLLRQVLSEAGLTAGLQQRASELIVALGADPAAQD